MRMRRWTLVAAAVMAVGLMAAGCGSKQTTVLPGVTVNQDGSGGSVSIKTDQGTVEVNAGDGKSDAKLPDGFPLKVMAGAKIDSSLKSTANGRQGYTVSLISQKEPAAIADFYEAELKGLGEKVQRNELSADGAVTITLAGDGDKDNGWITITREKDQKDVTIGIFWGQK